MGIVGLGRCLGLHLLIQTHTDTEIMSDKGSKDNVNEDNTPLMEGEEKTGETPEKEEVEMEEKKDESNEKEEKADKKKKEKKVKVPKVPKPKGPSCVETLSSGLDMGARDKDGINVEVDLDFSDVLAEPSSAHGFDPLWRLSFILFSNTKLWLYRLLSAILVLPLSLLWAVIFALFTILYVWVVRPVIKLVEVMFAVVKRVWVAALAATVEPLCASLGAFWSARAAPGLVESA